MELLVERAQRGDQLAFARLTREYRAAIRWWCRDYFGPGLTDDDVMQEALFGFWKAVRDFRDGNDSSFRSFAQLCVTRQLITAVKVARRQKYRALNEAVSADATGDEGLTLSDLLPALRGDPVAHLLGREQARELFAAIRLHLSPLEAKVVWAIDGEGESYAAVAAALGVDYKSVDNAAQRGRATLSEALSAGTRCRVCDAAIDYGKMCPPCAEEIEFAKQFLGAA